VVAAGVLVRAGACVCTAAVEVDAEGLPTASVLRFAGLDRAVARLTVTLSTVAGFAAVVVAADLTPFVLPAASTATRAAVSAVAVAAVQHVTRLTRRRAERRRRLCS
jgi:hypothetical protein